MRVRRLTRHVSVKDVALKSGVSFQTTSKVLNGKGSVSEVTRARILHAARDLGYVPNLLARSLVMHSTRAIGLVASDFSDQNLSRFVVGAEMEARRRGYGVIITSTESGSSTEDALPALMERRVDGLLLAAPPMEDDRRAAELLQRNLPVVSLNQVKGPVHAVVGSDDDAIGHMATAHLVERGHRRIGTIIGAQAGRAKQGRLRGYRHALEEAGIEFDATLVEEGGGESERALEATRRLVHRRPDLTAIFAQNDTMAMGVLSALRTLDRRVPEDCAVVGCDDIEMAAYAAPPLTTVHVPFYETGVEAMRLLIDMIENTSMAARKILLPVRLVIRASSGS